MCLFSLYSHFSFKSSHFIILFFKKRVKKKIYCEILTFPPISIILPHRIILHYPALLTLAHQKVIVSSLGPFSKKTFVLPTTKVTLMLLFKRGRNPFLQGTHTCKLKKKSLFS